MLHLLMGHVHHHIQDELAYRMQLRRIPRLKFLAAESDV